MNAVITIIRNHTFLTTPWKNGGGVTHEAIRVPASGEPFSWRVSVAHIEKSGPFSDFTGYHRTMLLLQGRGLDLAFSDGRRSELREAGDSAEFDGATATHCNLIDGPCMDLNLIAAKNLRTSAALQRLRGSFSVTAAPGETILIFSLERPLTLGDGPGNGTRVAPWDLAIISQGSAHVHAAEPGQSAGPIAVFIATISQ